MFTARHALLVLFTLLPLGAAQADEAAEKRARAEDDKGTFSILYENDKIGGTDQQYTNGFRAAYLSSTGGVPEWLRGVRPWLVPALDDDGAMRVGFALGPMPRGPMPRSAWLPTPAAGSTPWRWTLAWSAPPPMASRCRTTCTA